MKRAGQRTSRLLLDLQSGLLDEVWRRLSDAALLERADLRESIEQMQCGEGRVLRPIRENSPARR